MVAICLSLTAILAYLNHRYLHFPTMIGVMATSLGVSVAVVGLDAFGLDLLGVAHKLRLAETNLIRSADLGGLLLQGMLSLMLFAGAMHVDLGRLQKYKWHVMALSVISTSVSTAIVGIVMWYLLPGIGVQLTLPYCLLFGALISPTDPIAVMGIVKSAGAPKSLEVVIAGESLFNDGVGVVLFSLLLSFATSGKAPTLQSGLVDLLREAGGGLLFGYAIGWALYRLLQSVDHYQIEVLLTLAAVVGGYALANHLEVSGPLAMVVAGVMTGNRARRHAMSSTTRQYVDVFWELIDEILNALLFVLIGMQVLLIPFPATVVLAGALAAAVALVSRLLSVGAPVAFLGRTAGLPVGSWKVLTWGALRGGISVALALSIPASNARDVVLAMTYSVVVISIFGQGLTIGRLVRKAVSHRGATGPSRM
ncbi:cation:proton antiporter [Paraburkholderia dilworthii]|uniref:cation:proton antiporter n=1 Tax=Paraburkholderia dilworthii TaxID=948106 RepID=UPI001FCA84DA|nr:sodium:proton antiporter [Paraburkholderia dilworthii]